MTTTSFSLLECVKNRTDQRSWIRFLEVYVPLISYWLKKYGVPAEDTADLVQDILATLVEQLPDFEYKPSLRFRGWLHTISLNRARDWHRRQKKAQKSGLSGFVEALAAEEDANMEDVEFRQILVHRIQHVMHSEFEEFTWKAFWMNVAEGKSAREVSQSLGISENAVRLAKFRVVKRLRLEFDGIIP